jgi:hypothetical protein
MIKSLILSALCLSVTHVWSVSECAPDCVYGTKFDLELSIESPDINQNVNGVVWAVPQEKMRMEVTMPFLGIHLASLSYAPLDWRVYLPTENVLLVGNEPKFILPQPKDTAPRYLNFEPVIQFLYNDTAMKTTVQDSNRSIHLAKSNVKKNVKIKNQIWKLDVPSDIKMIQIPRDTVDSLKVKE